MHLPRSVAHRSGTSSARGKEVRRMKVTFEMLLFTSVAMNAALTYVYRRCAS